MCAVIGGHKIPKENQSARIWKRANQMLKLRVKLIFHLFSSVFTNQAVEGYAILAVYLEN